MQDLESGEINSCSTGTIAELLSSDFLDPDAPDPALYPKGMLLWNLRRPFPNVKKFVRNSIDTTATNQDKVVQVCSVIIPQMGN